MSSKRKAGATQSRWRKTRRLGGTQDGILEVQLRNQYQLPFELMDTISNFAWGQGSQTQYPRKAVVYPGMVNEYEQASKQNDDMLTFYYEMLIFERYNEILQKIVQNNKGYPELFSQLKNDIRAVMIKYDRSNVDIHSYMERLDQMADDDEIFSFTLSRIIAIFVEDLDVLFDNDLLEPMETLSRSFNRNNPERMSSSGTDLLEYDWYWFYQQKNQRKTRLQLNRVRIYQKLIDMYYHWVYPKLIETLLDALMDEMQISIEYFYGNRYSVNESTLYAMHGAYDKIYGPIHHENLYKKSIYKPGRDNVFEYIYANFVRENKLLLKSEEWDQFHFGRTFRIIYSIIEKGRLVPSNMHIGESPVRHIQEFGEHLWQFTFDVHSIYRSNFLDGLSTDEGADIETATFSFNIYNKLVRDPWGEDLGIYYYWNTFMSPVSLEYLFKRRAYDEIQYMYDNIDTDEKYKNLNIKILRKKRNLSDYIPDYSPSFPDQEKLTKALEADSQKMHDAIFDKHTNTTRQSVYFV